VTRRRIALLDVNVLVALFFPDHVHHETAHDWFADHRRAGWATCPITENGFIRVASQQSTGDGLHRPRDLAVTLARFCQDAHCHRWPAAVSLTDTSRFALQFVRGHAQLTDVYLLGVATEMRGCLATFDRTIPLQAVRGASADALQIIAPVA
jgi:toxin-antitoxin system PIN domain toxin